MGETWNTLGFEMQRKIDMEEARQRQELFNKLDDLGRKLDDIKDLLESKK